MTHAKEEPFRNSEEEYWQNIDVNDCGYLLRTLEREAFSTVVNALRAKGPPSEYTFILLDHLKSALSINDELGRAEIRRASSDQKLTKIASVLNPNYDTQTEWAVSSVEARISVEAGPSQARPFSRSTTNCMADQLLAQALLHNENVGHMSGRSVELLAIKPKPFVPERLRLLLRETDRPEERIRPPLETPPTPTHVPSSIPNSRSRSEVRPPPTKKRRQRTSKGAVKDGAIPPPDLRAELLPHDALMGVALEGGSDIIPGSPLTVNVPAAVIGSAGSVIISPGQPPQSGEIMKAWVSKIHQEQEAASVANSKRNGSGSLGTFPNDSGVPPLSTTPAPEEKKKRKPRVSQQQQQQETISLANTCARTRPFLFEPKIEGRQKPPRGNPDKRTSNKRASPTDFTGSFTSAVMSGATMTASHMAAAVAGPSGINSSVTPLARPHVTDLLPPYGGRSMLLDESPMGAGAATGSTSASSSPAGMRSGVGVPSTPTTHVMKRGGGYGNSVPRTQSRSYWVNSGIGGPSTSHGSPNLVKSTSTTGSLGGRTSSLGSQQLSSMQGVNMGMQMVGQKASSSTSSSSMTSIGGGSRDSGIGGSSSSSSTSLLNTTDPAVPVTALPPEEYGHDYGVTMPPPSSLSTAPAAAAAMQQPSGSGLSYVGGTHAPPPMRMTPRVLAAPRARLANPSLRSPGVTNSPQHLAALNGLPPSASSTPPSSLQRAGSLSSIRPRAASRGAAPAAVAAPMGERTSGLGTNAVTDGMVQATVNTIMLEAAQKECANGKRMTVPKELIEKRDNGMIVNRQSPVPGPSTQQPPYAVCRTTVAAGSGAAESAAAPSAPAATAAPRLPMHEPSNISTGLGVSGLMSPSPHGHLSSSSAPPSSFPPPFIPTTQIFSSIHNASTSSQSSANSTPLGVPNPPINFFSSSSSAIPGTTNPLPNSTLPQLPPASVPMAFPESTMNLRQFFASTNPQLPHGEGYVIVPGNPGFSVLQPVRIAAAAAAAASPVAAAPVVSPAQNQSRPAPRQYMLQPAGQDYSEFSMDYTRNLKKFSLDGPQYMVTAEDLYDQGVLARPSTSGLNRDGGGGGNGSTSRDQESLSFIQQMQQQSVPFGLPITSVPMTSIGSEMHLFPQLYPTPTSASAFDPGAAPAFAVGAAPAASTATAATAASSSTAPPPSDEQGRSEVTDILQQSCLELGSEERCYR